MSKPDIEKRRIVSKDSRSLYVEVYRATFKDVGKTGNEYTGRHEFHYRVSEGFGLKFQLTETIDERLLRDAVRTSIERWLHVTPEIDQASRVSRMMHGRVQVKATLISSDQVLNCIADFIRVSDIAKSEIRLVSDADKLLLETEGLASRSRSILRLRSNLRACRDDLAMAMMSDTKDTVTSKIPPTEDALYALEMATRILPSLEMRLSMKGKDLIVRDNRRVELILVNKGNRIKDISGNAKDAEGRDVLSFGPFELEAKKNIEIDLGEPVLIPQQIILVLSCCDAEGRRFAGEFPLKLGDSPSDAPLTEVSY